MKYILFACLVVTLWTACQPTPATPVTTTAPSPSTPAFDSTREKTAVTAAVRGFFDWYSKYMQTPAFSDEKFVFIDYKTPHPALKPTALDAYLQEFVKGGFAGQGFVQRQKAFYQKAAVLWQKEEQGDIPSGMDADPYFCAQDDVAEYYLKAPVQVQFTDPQHATATLNVTDPTMDLKLKVFVQKEDGKWLYVGTECDLGVE
jgi:hypothetical protein